MSNFDDRLNNNRVGPVIRAGDIASAVIEAAELDNPTKTIVVDDMNAYVRISTEDELIITRATMKECLGRSF